MVQNFDGIIRHTISTAVNGQGLANGTAGFVRRCAPVQIFWNVGRSDLMESGPTKHMKLDGSLLVIVEKTFVFAHTLLIHPRDDQRLANPTALLVHL